jgi:hypothetical protein
MTIGYYIFGFCLGLATGVTSERGNTRRKINLKIHESINKSHQIENYKRFIESRNLTIEYSKFIEKKE